MKLATARNYKDFSLYFHPSRWKCFKCNRLYINIYIRHILIYTMRCYWKILRSSLWMSRKRGVCNWPVTLRINEVNNLYLRTHNTIKFVSSPSSFVNEPWEWTERHGLTIMHSLFAPCPKNVQDVWQEVALIGRAMQLEGGSWDKGQGINVTVGQGRRQYKVKEVEDQQDVWMDAIKFIYWKLCLDARQREDVMCVVYERDGKVDSIRSGILLEEEQ
jgi:hypothetical protein